MRLCFMYASSEAVEECDADVVTLIYDFSGAQPAWCIFGHDYSGGRDGTTMRKWRLSDVVIPPHVPSQWHKFHTLLTLPMDPHRTPGI